MPRLSCTRLAVVGQGRGSLRDAILSTALPETLAYIATVEGPSGDNQPLEDGVLAAMVTFANWRIPLGGACCLMTGPRTLAGALVSMVGPAPTGVNLVAGDYDRLRVQLGVGAKYVQSNTLATDWGQNSRHAYLRNYETFTTGGGVFVFGGSSTASSDAIAIGGAGAFVSRSVTAGNVGFPGNYTSFEFAAGGIGVFRDSAPSAQIMWAGVTASYSVASAVPTATALNFGASSSGAQVSAMRASSYSTGPYIDPTDLDTRMTAAVNAIDRALNPLRYAIFDQLSVDTLEYLFAVEAADGERLENDVLAAMGSFAEWRIPLGGACCLMAGPRTLAGALTPMVGDAPTGVNLVEGDYNRLRVALDGVTKYFEANRNQDDDPQDDHHRAVNLAANWVLGLQRYLLNAGNASSAPTGRLDIRTNSAGTAIVWASNSGWLIQALSSAQAGIVFVGRNNATDMTLRRNGVTLVSTRESAAPETVPITIGARDTGDHTDAEVNGYSLGPYIDPDDLDTRTAAAVNAITAALA